MFSHIFHAVLATVLAVTPSAAVAATEVRGGYTLRIGATSVTGTPAESLGWGDRQGTLTKELKAAGVDKIEYSFFQSGGDAVSASIAGAVDVAPSVTIPPCGPAVATRKSFCRPLIRSTATCSSSARGRSHQHPGSGRQEHHGPSRDDSRPRRPPTDRCSRPYGQDRGQGRADTPNRSPD